jgi:ribosomal protein L23
MKSINKKISLLRPVLSEKTLKMYNTFKICTFLVNRESTKKQIGYDFEEQFGVKPEAVRVVTSRDIVNTRNRKTYSQKLRRRFNKKAYISVGDNKIDIFEKVN